MRQLFYIEGRLLGEAPRTLLQIDRGVYGIPLSNLFFCAHCGDVFARCPLIHPTRGMSSWRAVYSCCRRCKAQSGQHVPGSIWMYETEFTDAFPDAVLRWELDRHLDKAEKELTNELPQP